MLNSAIHLSKNSATQQALARYYQELAQFVEAQAVTPAPYLVARMVLTGAQIEIVGLHNGHLAVVCIVPNDSIYFDAL